VKDIIYTLDIQEAFTVRDGQVLTKLAESVAHEGVIFVEVGSWKGYSTSFLGEVAKNCGGVVYAPGVIHHALVDDCFQIFCTNMKELRLNKVVLPMIMTSQQAVRIFEQADLVFIDGDHRYESISKDIPAWWTKVKEGGILCGHDCENYYSSYTEKEREAIDINLDDFCPQTRCHAGVVKTLDEIFGRQYQIHIPSTVWSKSK
jgi:predicted O-methyltransferase YrrM